ncbi:MAG: hypothetical protein O2856_10045 [Planctomycetota bacterium]|nr:hypothetical protein [Planctomycetota bacterium]
MRILALYCGAILMILGTTGMAIAEQLSEAEIAAREEAFSKSMSNCVLVGSFTIDGKGNKDAPREERYEIESVTKASENLWIFTTRVKYGKLDTKLPITVPVEWAGDTPMVTLTKANLPGLGEGFSARVLFYEGRYAGTWQHGTVGGHMYGSIEQLATEKPKGDK